MIKVLSILIGEFVAICVQFQYMNLSTSDAGNLIAQFENGINSYGLSGAITGIVIAIIFHSTIKKCTTVKKRFTFNQYVIWYF